MKIRYYIMALFSAALFCLTSCATCGDEEKKSAMQDGEFEKRLADIRSTDKKELFDDFCKGVKISLPANAKMEKDEATRTVTMTFKLGVASKYVAADFEQNVKKEMINLFKNMGNLGLLMREMLNYGDFTVIYKYDTDDGKTYIVVIKGSDLKW